MLPDSVGVRVGNLGIVSASKDKIAQDVLRLSQRHLFQSKLLMYGWSRCTLEIHCHSRFEFSHVSGIAFSGTKSLQYHDDETQRGIDTSKMMFPAGALAHLFEGQSPIYPSPPAPFPPATSQIA